jgi:hypothetical protein
MKRATLEELTRADGMTRPTAERVYRALHSG